MNILQAISASTGRIFVAIIPGRKTQLVALALAGLILLSVLIFHADFADQPSMAMNMKNIAISGGFITLFARGPGAYALDNRNNH